MDADVQDFVFNFSYFRSQIKDDLRSGAHVIIDRYAYSGVAYTAAKQVCSLCVLVLLDMRVVCVCVYVCMYYVCMYIICIIGQRGERDTYRGNTIENRGCLFIYMYSFHYTRVV